MKTTIKKFVATLDEICREMLDLRRQIHPVHGLCNEETSELLLFTYFLRILCCVYQSLRIARSDLTASFDLLLIPVRKLIQTLELYSKHTKVVRSILFMMVTDLQQAKNN